MTDAKEYLRRPNKILGDINILREKAETLRENVLPKGVSFDKEKVQSIAGDKMLSVPFGVLIYINTIVKN